MPIQTHLLSRAYLLAEKKKNRDAAILLNTVVQQDPNNIEAWEFYLSVFARNMAKLEELGERIRKSDQIFPYVKEEVLPYFDYLVSRAKIRELALEKRRRLLVKIGHSLLGLLFMLILLLLPLEVQFFILRLVLGVVLVIVGYFAERWMRRRKSVPTPVLPNATASFAKEVPLLFLKTASPPVETADTTTIEGAKRRSPRRTPPRKSSASKSKTSSHKARKTSTKGKAGLPEKNKRL